MRCDTFVRSAVFAAVAAMGWLPWLLLVGPFLGAWSARSSYLVGVAALYVAGLSRARAARVSLAMGTLAAGVGLALVSRTSAEIALGLATLLGIVRSVFLYRALPARAVVTEVCLLGGGLLFARFLAGPSPASTGFALWGFLLVQSLFFLAPAGRTPTAGDRRADPFEEAYRSALALLERTGT
jgi:hypothetical protein